MQMHAGARVREEEIKISSAINLSAQRHASVCMHDSRCDNMMWYGVVGPGSVNLPCCDCGGVPCLERVVSSRSPHLPIVLDEMDVEANLLILAILASDGMASAAGRVMES